MLHKSTVCRSNWYYPCCCTAARLLGAAYAIKGNYALAFPSFGPERRGAPIRAFTKLDDKPIGNRSETEKADFSIFLDDTLFSDAAFNELKPESIILLNTKKHFENNRIFTIDANTIAEEILKRPITNTIMLGAFAAISGKISFDDISEAIRQYIAEDQRVSTPFMANLDGFVLTHTYEVVDVPTKTQEDEFLPPFKTENKLDLNNPKNLAFSAGPAQNTAFKYKEHIGLLNAKEVIGEAEEKFAEIFGRKYSGLTEEYRTDDADYIIVTLGSIAGLVRETVDKLRNSGKKVGLLRIRYLRPFPNEEIAEALKNAKAAAVLEKDISFGNEGTVYPNVNSALKKQNIPIPTSNYIGGLGGKNISESEIENIFNDIENGKTGVTFLGLGGE